MRNCLLLVSLLAMTALTVMPVTAGLPVHPCHSCLPVHPCNPCSIVAPAPSGSPSYLLPLDARQQFHVTIEARGAEITGICVVKPLDDGSFRGAIVNEFGVHALDFSVTADRRRVRLHNVAPMLNRWYLKRILRKDLRLLFTATQEGIQRSRRTISRDGDGTLTLANPYRIAYHFKPIDTHADDTAE